MERLYVWKISYVKTNVKNRILIEHYSYKITQSDITLPKKPAPILCVPPLCGLE